MDDKDIIGKLEAAIAQLRKDDYHLLRRGLSEQSISHKLAEKLQVHFHDYHVDCEYNGDIENDSEKKQIHFLKQNLLHISDLSEKEQAIENELLTRGVFPDIIIHKRGTNESNLCIIEVKKPGNIKADNYDKFKLELYTSSDAKNNNHLCYQLGVFALFVPGEGMAYSLLFFKNGHEVEFK